MISDIWTMTSMAAAPSFPKAAATTAAHLALLPTPRTSPRPSTEHLLRWIVATTGTESPPQHSAPSMAPLPEATASSLHGAAAHVPGRQQRGGD